MALVHEQFQVSERRACKLLGVDRSTYRYEPRPDHNAELREELVTLARQKPRYGYRRLHVLLERRGQKASEMRLHRLYREEGLAVRRRRRKRLSRPEAKAPLHVRSNQEWALDFVADTLGTGRGIRVLAVVDAFSAMTDDRAYRRGRSTQEAFAELARCAGTQFDPKVVEVFLQLWKVE